MISKILARLKKKDILLHEDLHEYLSDFEKSIEYEFTDRELLLQALKHRSYTSSIYEDRIESNERLEFLGDSILNFTVSEYIYNFFPDKSEGELTKIRSIIVSGDNLSETARSISLGKYILMSENEDNAGGRDKDSILEDTLESVIGAIFVDGGMQASTKFITRTFLEDLNFTLADKRNSNYKSDLLELVQSYGMEPPKYELIMEEGPEHEKTFTVNVLIKGRVIAEGCSSSKKRAEQEASSKALEIISRDNDFFK